VSERVDQVIILPAWGLATLHLPTIWPCTHFPELLHPGEMKPMTEGTGVGRGATGLQTLDASRGMSSPWGGVAVSRSGSTYLPVKEYRRVMRYCWGCKEKDVPAPHRLKLPRSVPRSFHSNCALPFPAGFRPEV
jgi:hypothetical protein